ncbi:hypothetical protein E3N88_41212 [Mikania micrantha]|uniref:Phytocyanin domain-containing protein n=1 Tax=Mikania micrantha TaxID=192012 RepID=A0A5N6LPX6_9ASTR|nr:hypothetical protein E3N88_41212 [Mikania micrantha]
MAGSIKFSLCFITFSLLFSLNFVAYEATKFVVGGEQNLWTVTSPAGALNAWAEKERFKIGDMLVFKYDSNTDSVLRVEEGDYKKCIKTKPITEYHDGNSVFPITESGSFFFISGADGHCEKGEKVEVRVLSRKHSAPPPVMAPNGSPAGVPRPVESPESSSSIGSSLGFVGVSYIAGVAALVGIAMWTHVLKTRQYVQMWIKVSIYELKIRRTGSEPRGRRQCNWRMAGQGQGGNQIVTIRENASISLQCPLLNQTNYTIWAVRLKAIFNVHGLWEVIEVSQGAAIDVKKNNTAIAYLYQAMPEDMVLQFAQYGTSKEIWDALKARFVGIERVKKARLQTLRNEFELLRMKDEETIDDFAGKISAIA